MDRWRTAGLQMSKEIWTCGRENINDGGRDVDWVTFGGVIMTHDVLF